MRIRTSPLFISKLKGVPNMKPLDSRITSLSNSTPFSASTNSSLILRKIAGFERSGAMSLNTIPSLGKSGMLRKFSEMRVLIFYFSLFIFDCQ